MANKALIELSSKVYSKTAGREELAEFTKVINTLRQKGATNPQVLWELNQIITKTAEEILRPRLNFLDYIAETQHVNHGEKIEFQVPAKTRMGMKWTARGTTVDYQRVGGASKFTAEPEIIAGGAYYEIDQLLSGNVGAFIGVVDALVEDMERQLTGRVINTLATVMAAAPAANKWSGAGITPTNFSQVTSTVQRYDRNTSVIVDIDFAKKLTGFIGAESMSDAMKEQKNNNGLFGRVDGTDIIVFQNPFEDDTNTTLAAPRKYGFVVPASASGKVVKIGFEGGLEQYTKTDIDSERVFLKVTQKASCDAVTTLSNLGFLEDTNLA
ncbi:hypothetical protein ABEY43_06495 [Priestia megaterium]